MAEMAIMRDIPAAPLDEARDEEIGWVDGYSRLVSHAYI